MLDTIESARARASKGEYSLFVYGKRHIRGGGEVLTLGFLAEASIVAWQGVDTMVIELRRDDRAVFAYEFVEPNARVVEELMLNARILIDEMITLFEAGAVSQTAD